MSTFRQREASMFFLLPMFSLEMWNDRMLCVLFDLGQSLLFHGNDSCRVCGVYGIEYCNSDVPTWRPGGLTIRFFRK